jgi:hypothetical protein
VTGPFEPEATDTIGESKVKTLISVPTRDATVARMSWIDPYASGVKHFTVDAVVHDVDAHEFKPTLAESELSAAPKPTPWSVMYAEPLDGEFIGSMMLSTGESYVNMFLIVPSMLTTVTDT